LDRREGGGDLRGRGGGAGGGRAGSRARPDQWPPPAHTHTRARTLRNPRFIRPQPKPLLGKQNQNRGKIFVEKEQTNTPSERFPSPLAKQPGGCGAWGRGRGGRGGGGRRGSQVRASGGAVPSPAARWSAVPPRTPPPWGGEAVVPKGGRVGVGVYTQGEKVKASLFFWVCRVLPTNSCCSWDGGGIKERLPGPSRAPEPSGRPHRHQRCGDPPWASGPAPWHCGGRRGAPRSRRGGGPPPRWRPGPPPV